MNAQEFIDELTAANQALLERLDPSDTLETDALGNLDILNLLKIALKNELEATEIAARWLCSADNLDVKLALARQVGDEAKHYRLIQDRLGELGAPAAGFDPLASGYSPLFNFLDSLTDTGRARRRRPVHPRGHRRGEESAVH